MIGSIVHVEAYHGSALWSFDRVYRQDSDTPCANDD